MAADVRPRVGYRFFAYDPLSFVAFPDYPKDLPTGKYLKRLPRFTGKMGVSVEDHFVDFLQLVDDFDVEHEDVCTDPRGGDMSIAWYKSLSDASNDGWDSFQGKFIKR